MPWGDLAAHAAGTLLELGWAAVLAPLLAVLVGRRAAGAWRPVLVCAAVAAVAAPDLALPLNPVPPGERNLVVAVVALAVASWTGVEVTAATADERRMVLTATLGFVLASALVAVTPGTVRPQAVGTIVLGAEAPVKVASAALALLSLPAATGVLLEKPLRPPVWAALALPYAALLVSEFVPPPADLLAAGRWLAALGAVLAITLLLGRLVSGRPERAGIVHRRLLPAAAAVASLTTLLVALL